MIGELTGKAGTARCRVRRDADGAAYIEDVTPLLPDGNYRLLVNGLTFDVRFAGGHWRTTDN